LAEPKSDSGLRGNDLLISQALREVRRPMSAYDLIERLRDQGISAPTTVYRSLNRLMAKGYVHRLESLNAFVCCVRDGRHDAAVFAICEGCGAVEEFADEVVAARLSDWARATGFALEHATIELRGRCPSCGPSAHRGEA